MEKSILVVDDDVSAMKTFVRYIGRYGYNIFTASSCEEAFSMLETIKVSVIVSDYRMPGMNGMEFLKEVKIRYPDTVRILISGYIDLNMLIELFNDSLILKFIPKPWTDLNIRKILDDAFEYSRRASGGKQG